ETIRAAGELVNPVAGPAVEVVVVLLARRLVARRLAGQVDLRQRALFGERLDRPIDGGDAETGTVAAGRVQHLFRAQRPAIVLDGAPDGATLLRVSFHHG